MLKINSAPAMTLWMRNIVLLELYDSSSWWIQGPAQCKTGVRAAASICALMPKNLHWTTEWPMKVINKEVTLQGCRTSDTTKET